MPDSLDPEDFFKRRKGNVPTRGSGGEVKKGFAREEVSVPGKIRPIKLLNKTWWDKVRNFFWNKPNPENPPPRPPKEGDGTYF